MQRVSYLPKGVKTEPEKLQKNCYKRKENSRSGFNYCLFILLKLAREKQILRSY